MTRALKIVGLALGSTALIAAGAIGERIYDRNDPEVHADPIEHFKYGSIGAETERSGLPFWIWYVLPRTFPDLLPDRPGNGYERFGFVYESPSNLRPVGISYRQRRIPMVSVNCATCHAGTIREPGGPPRIVLGMPSHQLDLQAYTRFLFAVSRDPRFNADTLIAAIEQANPEFSWRDRLIYRFLVVPLSKSEFARFEPDFAWQLQRPPQGPGRVDTFNPYKVLLRMPMDESVGTADLPTLFDQKAKNGMALHWDGNNDVAAERNRSAAIGGGCTEDSLDLEALKRVEDWIWELRGPPFPPDRIDGARAARGAALYHQHCADCHDSGGTRTGTVIPLEEIGTDPERLQSFTAGLAERMNTIGSGRPWKFTHFRKTNGYASVLLESVWLRAPYLHNGSVPTLRDLLNRPEERPTRFYRGYDVYDYANVGFVSEGQAAVRAGFEHRTTLKGNSNAGHLYGTGLSPVDKADLLEFLKTR